MSFRDEVKKIPAKKYIEITKEYVIPFVDEIIDKAAKMQLEAIKCLIKKRAAESSSNPLEGNFIMGDEIKLSISPEHYESDIESLLHTGSYVREVKIGLNIAVPELDSDAEYLIAQNQNVDGYGSFGCSKDNDIVCYFPEEGSSTFVTVVKLRYVYEKTCVRKWFGKTEIVSYVPNGVIKKFSEVLQKLAENDDITVSGPTKLNTALVISYHFYR